MHDVTDRKRYEQTAAPAKRRRTHPPQTHRAWDDAAPALLELVGVISAYVPGFLWDL